MSSPSRTAGTSSASRRTNIRCSGRAYRKKGYLIPEAGRTARGTNIVNIIPVEPGERVNAMLHMREMEDGFYLVLATRNGTVKRMELTALKNIRNSGIRALGLDEGDELINVMLTDGSQNILMATHNGQAICFAETDVRPMGREAVGVRGIRLSRKTATASAPRQANTSAAAGTSRSTVAAPA